MIKKQIGENAGIIWRALNEKHEMGILELIEVTHLKKNEILFALGWLSKENKVYFFENEKEYRICLIEN